MPRAVTQISDSEDECQTPTPKKQRTGKPTSKPDVKPKVVKPKAAKESKPAEPKTKGVKPRGATPNAVEEVTHAEPKPEVANPKAAKDGVPAELKLKVVKPKTVKGGNPAEPKPKVVKPKAAKPKVEKADSVTPSATEALKPEDDATVPPDIKRQRILKKPAAGEQTVDREVGEDADDGTTKSSSSVKDSLVREDGAAGVCSLLGM